MTLRRAVPAVLAIPVLVAYWAVSQPAEARVRVRMGTVVPKGSAWHETLQYIQQEWRRITNGEVDVRVYPGGYLGDEVEMVRQVRQGRIQAVGLSSVGLSHIDDGVSALQVPMMFASYEELDYVRDRMAPKLEKRLEAKGFKVLNWGDGGWVKFFTKAPARTLDDLRKRKLFTSAGDPDTEALYKEFGFRVVPLSLTDMLVSLQTNMIDAFSVPPLFAMLDNSYEMAPHMIDVNWAPLIGGTVISTKSWAQMPAEHRPALLKAAQEAGKKLRGEIRSLGDDAESEMRNRGLKIATLDDATLAAWRAEAEDAYPKLRDRFAPGELIDEALRLRDEYRANK